LGVFVLSHPRRFVRMASLLIGVVLALVAAAPAVADPIGRIVTNPGTQEGAFGLAAPIVTFGNGQLTITNPASNGPNNVITDMDGALPNGSGVGFESFAGPNFNGPYCGKGYDVALNEPGIIPPTFSCLPANQRTGVGGIRPGETRTYPYRLSDASYKGGLMWVEVWFNFDDVFQGCRPAVAAASWAGSGGGPFATTADDCVAPSKTKIVHPKVNQAQRTLSMRLTAKRNSGFYCELFLHHHVNKGPCGANIYIAHLPRGDYLFMAFAVNHAGTDPHPAYMSFRVR
jgi:hypothetical protein